MSDAGKREEYGIERQGRGSRRLKETRERRSQDQKGEEEDRTKRERKKIGPRGRGRR